VVGVNRDQKTPNQLVTWHDLECAYDADLHVWKQLADSSSGSILELGCGTGRVSLELASGGLDITALDIEPVLLEALSEEALRRGVRLTPHCGDALSTSFDQTFGLVIAPMQLVQLLQGKARRHLLFSNVRRHLDRGGRFAAALCEPSFVSHGAPPLPDICEHDGWVFSSLPLGVRFDGDSFLIERLRHVVSASGSLEQSHAQIRLWQLSPEDFEQEASCCAFRPIDRHLIEATGAHVASTVCVLEAV
jgi:SAM-dependent methyltransferase